jgi:ubiquinone/menaquinone biosynthesis C-methylase UbiE
MIPTIEAASYDGYTKYDRTVAASYERDRQVEAHWWKEDAFVRDYFSATAAPRLLDLPVGTGRFFPHYKRSEMVVGVDVSADMLNEAKQKLRLLPAGVAGSVERGDVFGLRFENGAFTHAIVWRLFHLIPEALLPAAIAELCRVTANEVVVQAYVAAPEVGTPRPSYISRLAGRARRLGRSLNPLAVQAAPTAAMNADGAADAAAPAPWSHIQSYSHAQSQIDALFLGQGFAPRITRQLDTYDSCDVRVTVFRR